MTTEANGPAPTDEEVEAAMLVIRRALIAKETPVMLVEYGSDFRDKLLFCQLDYIRTNAGALGYDTTTMRDHGATR